MFIIKKLIYIIFIVIITSLVFAYSSEHTKLTTAFKSIDSLNNKLAELEQENSKLKTNNEIIHENIQVLMEKEPVEFVESIVPWMKSSSIDSCVITSMIPYKNIEVTVPNDILDSLKLNKFIHYITATYTSIPNAPFSEVNCYK